MLDNHPERSRWDRRQLLQALTAAGVGSVVFQRALAAQAEVAEVSTEMIKHAEWIAGVAYSDGEREAALRAVQSQQSKLATLRVTAVDYGTPPALVFNPTPGKLHDGEVQRGTARLVGGEEPPQRPAGDDDLAFLPVTRLASLVRRRKVSSVELTRLYLDRLHEFDQVLNCVVTFTDDLALRQAKRADADIAAGNYRGLLHGIPWGAKDLIAYPGYKTTWGAVPFQDQVLDTKATVAARLDEAGAVLLAKLSLGALAWGDGWFRGQTRNPWHPQTGSSGSSAGSAAATAAGLVGFSLGSETLGSIISPCRVCGCTGLRPTFGRVSRAGCMSLAWSMDKLGPICRSVEDCALVLDAIHGADGVDPTAVNRPFAWPPERELKSMRIGYFTDREKADEVRPELATLRELGVTLVPIQLPEDLPASALTIILDAEATAMFDGLVREGKLAGTGLWPNSFRRGELLPAVEYLRANRIRTQLVQRMEELMRSVDAYVGGNDLTITNFTGHPTVVLPVGIETKDDRTLPQTITFTGRLYGEAELLALAYAYEQAIQFQGRPDLAHLRNLIDEARRKPESDSQPEKKT